MQLRSRPNSGNAGYPGRIVEAAAKQKDGLQASYDSKEFQNLQRRSDRIGGVAGIEGDLA
jgi:hypothetical protein